MLLWLSHMFWHGRWSWQFAHAVGARAAFSMLTAWLLVLFSGSGFIRYLQCNQMGQVVRDDGPQSHLSKQGTPTMGGILIIVSIVLSTILWTDWHDLLVWLLLLVTVGFAAIGLFDDISKVRSGSSAGLSARMKYALQSLLALAVLFFIYKHAGTTVQTSLFIPFSNGVIVHLGVSFLALGYFVLVGSSNAVNLTDGLDGLAVLPTIMIAAALAAFAYISSDISWSTMFALPYLPGTTELVVFCGSLFGAGLAFLWFNSYPAQVFMGDVGSLALGAALGMLAVLLSQEIVFFIMSGLFVMETISVILQVASFKMTGKRIFKMAPLHHHFELKGWPEPRITTRFSIISCMLVAVGLLSLILR